MAGDYFDADQYAAEQQAALANDVLGGAQNGLSPVGGGPAPMAPAVDSYSQALERMRAEQARRDEVNAGKIRGLMRERLPAALSGVPLVGAGLSGLAQSAVDAHPEREKLGPKVPAPAGLQKLVLAAQDPKLIPQDESAGYPPPRQTAAEDPFASLASAQTLTGGGGGGGGMPSRAKLEAAQSAQLQGLTDAGNLQSEKGIDQALAVQGVSDLREINAARMQRDAEIQQAEDQKAAERHQAFLTRQEQLADEIGKMQVDPSRLMHSSDLKTQLVFGMGAALGGMNAAMNGGPNTSLDRLDKMIDRDIDSQIKAIDTKQLQISDRNSLFTQMLAETGDRRQAAMQTKKLIYDAMDLKFKADADRLGIPELRDNAAIISQEYERKRNDLATSIADENWKREMAAANARASAAAAAAERAWQHQVTAAELRLKSRGLDIEEGKIKNGPGAKDAGDRAVVLDGQNALAVNKTAAEKWNEYNHGRAVFATALQELKAARERGDVGAYNAARANLIEEYPKLLGYTRAPTEGQIKATVGPEAIPEYNHWYQHVGTLGVTYGVQQGRAEEKLKILDKTLAVSDKAMRENTFGANAPTAAGANAPSFKPNAEKK